MSTTSDRCEPQWHVLDFFTDDSSDSALTVYVSGRRFHIVAIIEQLRKDTPAGKRYRHLLRNVQHESDATSPAKEDSPGDRSSDSGVDVREPEVRADDEHTQQQDGCEERTAEEALQMWMVSPLEGEISELVTNTKRTRSLEEWYHCETTFLELVSSDNDTDVQANILESTQELQQRIEGLIPNMILPKYLSNTLTATWFQSSELEVVDCSDQPIGTPYHPCRVRCRETGDIYFLKVVDNEQPQPFKRELDILNRMEQAGLHEQINVPQLEGLVQFDNTKPTKSGQKRIMGMLLTDIPNPTPLTTKLDTTIPQEKRDAWAKEANMIKNILHDHDIIWGDAKADNFMVDEDGELWIIDFGGSYTEGWVDPELNETEEGDEMGVGKVVRALEDPVGNVCWVGEDEEGEDEKDGERQTEPSPRQSKRKRGGEEDGSVDAGGKRSKVETPR